MNTQELNEIFDISQDIELDSNLPMPPVIQNPAATSLKEIDLIQDIDFTRRSLQSLLLKSQQLVELSLENASDSAGPRNIEVASNAINTAVNTAEKLIDLNKKYQELTDTKKDLGTNNTFINKTINVTTADLLKMLKEDNDGEII